MKRDSATAPTIGDRVAYVIVKGAKGVKASDKAEDPIYVLENNLPIDAQHYLEHQLTQPLMRIFEPIIGEKKAKSLLSGAERIFCRARCSNAHPRHLSSQHACAVAYMRCGDVFRVLVTVRADVSVRNAVPTCWPL